MVPENQCLPSVQPGEQLVPALPIPEAEVSEDPCQVLRIGYDPVPVRNQRLIHLLHAVKGSVVVGDDTVMVKVHIREIPDGHGFLCSSLRLISRFSVFYSPASSSRLVYSSLGWS